MSHTLSEKYMKLKYGFSYVQDRSQCKTFFQLVQNYNINFHAVVKESIQSQISTLILKKFWLLNRKEEKKIIGRIVTTLSSKLLLFVFKPSTTRNDTQVSKYTEHVLLS